MTASPPEAPLLTEEQVAAEFGVDVKTVTRWAKAGKITPVPGSGRHRKYRQEEVKALREGNA
jgi:predicted site-specific integrase-resolvase